MKTVAVLRLLLKPAFALGVSLLLSACLFTVEPVLDETNSLAASDSADYRVFWAAWRDAYGEEPHPVKRHYLILDDDGAVDISSIRVRPLENGMMLVQEQLRNCISGYCYALYGARMPESWWPDSCFASTTEEGQVGLAVLAEAYGVKILPITEGKRFREDFGVDGAREDILRFLEVQFTEGLLECSGDDKLPIHAAAEMRRPEWLAMLIGQGADPDARDSLGATALHHASAFGYPENVSVLAGAGADIDAGDAGGLTPLHYAAMVYDIPVLMERMFAPMPEERGDTLESLIGLLDHGADVNARDDSGATPLHLAALAGGTPPDEFIPPKGGVALLIEAGADLNARDKTGATPLHRAAQANDYNPANKVADLVLLIEAGAEIDARDNAGATPLHYAADDWIEYHVKLLVERGADMNARDTAGQTPLHLLVDDPQTVSSQVELLVAAGADIDARDNFGRTPLHHAVAGWLADAADPRDQAISALLDAGADASLTDSLGRTPRDIAMQAPEKFGQTDLLTRLEQAGRR